MAECLAESCNASYDEVLTHLSPYGWVSSQSGCLCMSPRARVL